MKNIYQDLLFKKSKGIKSFSILLDPDNSSVEKTINIIQLAVQNNIDYFFVGGSLLTSDNLNNLISLIKKHCNIPVILFPGSVMQIATSADGILLLSLISGRNAEFLIGQHVVAAPILKNSNLEIIATGYILVDSGNQTTVSYMSNTTPVPYNKPAIAACTALAGEMLGLKLIYLDGGSGAFQHIDSRMIEEVRQQCTIPLIVGGGITNATDAENSLKAGADVIVIGNAIEQNPGLISEVAKRLQTLNKSNIH